MPNRRAPAPPPATSTPAAGDALPLRPGGHLRGASQSLLHSLMHRLGRWRMARLDPDTARLEAIRGEMLRALDGVDAAASRGLRDRITYATDIETLWYLRTDLHPLLGGALGADEAAARLQAITARFVGVLPAARSAGDRRR